MQNWYQQNFQEILNYLQNYWSFLLIWITSPLILITIGVFYAYNDDGHFSQLISQRGQFNQQDKTEKRNLVFYVEIGLFIAFLFYYIYLILYKEDFAYHDNGQFTFFSLQGKFFGMPIWKEVGRYWPLGLQEYNIISLFSKTSFAYHLFSIFQLVVTVFIIYLILDKLNTTYKFLIILLIMVTSGFVISFFGLIFPERNLIFWLTIFILCLQKFHQNKSVIYFSGILVATQFLLYYKEPIFLLISCFASTRLIINFLTDKNSYKSNLFPKFIKDNWLDFSLIILSIIFLIQYIIATWGKVKSSYASEREGDSQFSTFINYMSVDLILCTFIVVFLGRIVFLIVRKKRPDSIWDSLALGTFFYFLAYIKLNIFRWYYIAPFDFLATLYLAKMAFPILINKQKYKNSLVIILVTAIFLQNLHYSSYAILSRKKSIDSKVQIAKFLESYIASSDKADDVNLFFPANSGYEVMEFSSFLNYKGFNILPDSKTNSQKNTLVVNTFEQYPDNLCVPFRPFKCYYNNNPKPNDLIIFLPNDSMLFSPNLSNWIPKEQLTEFENNSVTIFHYQPSFDGLEKILFFFSTKNLINEEWLNAYIFSQWNVSKLNNYQNQKK